MAHQSVREPIPMGKSWSTGSSGTTGPVPASSAARWLKRERLKKLEQDASTSSSEMKTLEEEIHDLSTTLEKLRKFDAKRVERLGELDDGKEVEDDVRKKEKLPDTTQEAKGLNGEGEQQGLVVEGWEERAAQGERSGEGEVNEEVESLRSEHESAQNQILYTEASLEKKRVELEALAEKHQTLTDLLAEEKKHVQPAEEIDESLQQEKRSLSEDLGRLGRLVEGLKETKAGPVKQGSTRPLQKPRMYHPVTQLRSRQLHRVSQNGGGGPDLGRSSSVGDATMGTARIREPPVRSKEPSRIKEPAEFEEREGGGNRKRQKSSSFELERKRIHEERAKLEVEAKEKRRVLDSLASFSSQTQTQTQPSKGAPAAPGSSLSSRDISSPSSVFEGFGETPVGPSTSGFMVPMSDSSECSSEFSTERLDSNSIASAVKRLDFESIAKEDGSSPGATAPFPRDSPSKPSFLEILSRDGVNSNVDTGGEKSGEKQEPSSLEKGEECQSSESGHEEFPAPAVHSSNSILEENLGAEGISPVSGIEGMQGPEILSSEVEGNRESESMIPQSAPEQEEIQDPVSEVVNFQHEVLDSFSEGFGNPERETDATLEKTESNSFRGASKYEVEEIDTPSEEFDGFRDAGGVQDENSMEEEIITSTNRVEEIEVPEEDIEDFEDIELADETSEQKFPTKRTEDDNGERPLETKSEGCAYDDSGDEAIEVGQSTIAQTPELQENGFISSEPDSSWLQSPPEAGSAGQANSEEMSDERNDRRFEAEYQMMQLSSQLSLLQKQVEEEVELHEKSKTDSQLEHTFADKEQLSRQVSFFADEVRGLRQNIDEIQGILQREGELPAVEHWAKDLHSKCADQSAQLEHLGKQVSMLGNYLKDHLQLSADIDIKLDKEAQERQKVEAQLTDLSKALAFTVSTMEKEEEAMEEVIQHQKHLLVDQLKEAEKLRQIAEVRVLTLNDQIEQLEMVCDAAKSIQTVTKYQDKAFRYGLQTLMQLFLLALGVMTLYSRVAEPFIGSLVPT